MKKRIAIMTCLVLVFAMAGCGNTSTANKPGINQPAGVNDVLEQGMAEAENKNADITGQPAESDTQNPQSTGDQETKQPESSAEPGTVSSSEGSADGVDIDLTVLSSTMVYSVSIII